MNINLDPVAFTKNYISKLSAVAPETQPETGGSAPVDSWYESGSKTVPSGPPTLSQIDRDVKTLEVTGAPERELQQYLGMALLSSVMAAVGGGVSPLSSHVYLTVAASVAKDMIPVESDRELTAPAASSLMSASGVNRDPALNERACSVVANLQKHSSLEGLEVHVLNSADVNASALPGKVFATKGLLDTFPDDGQLALILGHEIAHIEDRDSMEDIGRTMFDELAVSRTLLKSKVKVEDTEWNIGDYRKNFKDNFLSSTVSFKRENELAADRRGAELALKAGYGEEEALAALNTICTIERSALEKRVTAKVVKELGYVDPQEVARQIAEEERFMDHPPLAQRLEAVKGAAASLK